MGEDALPNGEGLRTEFWMNTMLILLVAFGQIVFTKQYNTEEV